MLPILLALVLATGGLVGMASGADGAAAYKDYTVTVADSSGQSLVSMNNSPALTIDQTFEGSFHMLVDAKGKFVIPASSVKLTQVMHGAAEGYTSKLTLGKDVKGQVGKGGDVQAVVGSKGTAKVKVKKTKDPGVVTFTMPLNTVTSAAGEATVTMVQTMTFTTGKAQIVGSKTKGSGLEGKSLSGQGKSIVLAEHGSVTLVGVGGMAKQSSGGSATVEGGVRDQMSIFNMVCEIAGPPPGPQEPGTYKVSVSGSTRGLTSQDHGPALDIGGTLSGTFTLMVDSKGKVLIPAKDFKLTQSLTGAAEGYTATLTLKKDIKTKFGTGGTVVGQLDAKKFKVKAKTKGPEGSLSFQADLISVAKDPKGTVVDQSVYQYTFTTGQAGITAKGTKNGFDGKSISETGAALHIGQGTGKLVGMAGYMNKKAPSDPNIDVSDFMGFMIINMDIK